MASYSRRGCCCKQDTREIDQRIIRGWHSVADINCSFCYKVCERYTTPDPGQCFEPRGGGIERYRWSDQYTVYTNIKQRRHLLMEVEEEKKRICKEIDEGKPPLQVNQNHLLHLQELLVRLERHIELDSGIYCFDCSSMES